MEGGVVTALLAGELGFRVDSYIKFVHLCKVAKLFWFIICLFGIGVESQGLSLVCKANF
ncbi:unnamed protein product [Rhodiola kirilowii]